MDNIHQIVWGGLIKMRLVGPDGKEVESWEDLECEEED